MVKSVLDEIFDKVDALGEDKVNAFFANAHVESDEDLDDFDLGSLFEDEDAQEPTASDTHAIAGTLFNSVADVKSKEVEVQPKEVHSSVKFGPERQPFSEFLKKFIKPVSLKVCKKPVLEAPKAPLMQQVIVENPFSLSRVIASSLNESQEVSAKSLGPIVHTKAPLLNIDSAVEVQHGPEWGVNGHQSTSAIQVKETIQNLLQSGYKVKVQGFPNHTNGLESNFHKLRVLFHTGNGDVSQTSSLDVAVPAKIGIEGPTQVATDVAKLLEINQPRVAFGPEDQPLGEFLGRYIQPVSIDVCEKPVSLAPKVPLLGQAPAVQASTFPSLNLPKPGEKPSEGLVALAKTTKDVASRGFANVTKLEPVEVIGKEPFSTKTGERQFSYISSSEGTSSEKDPVRELLESTYQKVSSFFGGFFAQVPTKAAEEVIVELPKVTELSQIVEEQTASENVTTALATAESSQEWGANGHQTISAFHIKETIQNLLQSGYKVEVQGFPNQESGLESNFHKLRVLLHTGDGDVLQTSSLDVAVPAIEGIEGPAQVESDITTLLEPVSLTPKASLLDQTPAAAPTLPSLSLPKPGIKPSEDVDVLAKTAQDVASRGFANVTKLEPVEVIGKEPFSAKTGERQFSYVSSSEGKPSEKDPVTEALKSTYQKVSSFFGGFFAPAETVEEVIVEQPEVTALSESAAITIDEPKALVPQTIAKSNYSSAFTSDKLKELEARVIAGGGRKVINFFRNVEVPKTPAITSSKVADLVSTGNVEVVQSTPVPNVTVPAIEGTAQIQTDVAKLLEIDQPRVAFGPKREPFAKFLGRYIQPVSIDVCEKPVSLTPKAPFLSKALALKAPTFEKPSEDVEVLAKTTQDVASRGFANVTKLEPVEVIGEEPFSAKTGERQLQYISSSEGKPSEKDSVTEALKSTYQKVSSFFGGFFAPAETVEEVIVEQPEVTALSESAAITIDEPKAQVPSNHSSAFTVDKLKELEARVIAGGGRKVINFFKNVEVPKTSETPAVTSSKVADLVSTGNVEVVQSTPAPNVSVPAIEGTAQVEIDQPRVVFGPKREPFAKFLGRYIQPVSIDVCEKPISLTPEAPLLDQAPTIPGLNLPKPAEKPSEDVVTLAKTAKDVASRGFANVTKLEPVEVIGKEPFSAKTGERQFSYISSSEGKPSEKDPVTEALKSTYQKVSSFFGGFFGSVETTEEVILEQPKVTALSQIVEEQTASENVTTALATAESSLDWGANGHQTISADKIEETIRRLVDNGYKVTIQGFSGETEGIVPNFQKVRILFQTVDGDVLQMSSLDVAVPTLNAIEGSQATDLDITELLGLKKTTVVTGNAESALAVADSKGSPAITTDELKALEAKVIDGGGRKAVEFFKDAKAPEQVETQITTEELEALFSTEDTVAQQTDIPAPKAEVVEQVVPQVTMPEQTLDAPRTALETVSSDLGTLAPPKAGTGKPITFSELKDLEARVIAGGGRKAVKFFKDVKLPEEVAAPVVTGEFSNPASTGNVEVVQSIPTPKAEAVEQVVSQVTMPEQTLDAPRTALETFSSDLGTLAPPKAGTGKPITFSELKDLEARVIAGGGRKAVKFFKDVKLPEEVAAPVVTGEFANPASTGNVEVVQSIPTPKAEAVEQVVSQVTMPEQTPDAARAALETFSSDLGTLAPPKADTGKPITFSELKDLEARVIADGGRKAVNFFKGVKVPEQVETSITTEELETLFSAEDTVDQQTVFPDLEAEIRQLQEQAVTTTAVGFPKPVVPKNPELEAMKESLDARAPVSFFNYLKRSGIINPTVADETRLNGSVTIMHPTGGAIPVMSAAQSSAVNELKQEAAKIVPKTTPNTFMSFLENNPVVRSTKEASVVPPVSTQKAPTTPNTFMSFLKNNPAVPSQPEVPVIPSQAPAAPQVTPPANPANNEVRRVVTEQKDNPIIAIGLTLLTVYAGYKLYKRYTQSDKKEELERYIATLSEVLKDNSALDDAYKIVRNGHISHELFAKKKKAKAFFEATRYMRRNKIKGISYLKSKRAFRSEMIKHLAEKKAELAAVKSRATLTSSLGSVFSKLGNVCGLPRLA